MIQHRRKISHSRTRRKSLSYSVPGILWTKIKNLKALLSHNKELYALKEFKEAVLASEGQYADQKFKNYRKSISVS